MRVLQFNYSWKPLAIFLSLSCCPFGSMANAQDAPASEKLAYPNSYFIAKFKYWASEHASEGASAAATPAAKETEPSEGQSVGLVSVPLALPEHLIERSRHGLQMQIAGKNVPAQWLPKQDPSPSTAEPDFWPGDVYFPSEELDLADAVNGNIVFEAFTPDQAGFVWKSAEGYDELLYNGVPALRYERPVLDESSPEAREKTYKPFHHVYSHDGKLLTKGAGGEYTHHRGLFHGYNKITYGEDSSKTADTWHCTGDAHQAHRRTLSMWGGPLVALHRVEIGWHGANKELFLVETRELRIERTPKGYRIFAQAWLDPQVRNVKLDGDPQHAGFQFRAAQEVAMSTKGQTYYLRPDSHGGKTAPGVTRNWPEDAGHVNMPWSAMSFVVEGKRYTAALFNEIVQDRQTRHSERDYGRFGSYTERDLGKHEMRRVAHDFWIEEGELSPQDVQKRKLRVVDPIHSSLATVAKTQDGMNTFPKSNQPLVEFTRLFDGSSLSGWKGLVADPPARAKMSGQELETAQSAADEKMRAHWKAEDGVLVFDGKGDSLCTSQDYANFEMYVDWKIEPKGDSGIYLRGSPQVQIWDDPIGSGALYNNQKNPSKPFAVADHPVGQWNRFFIRMVGDEVTVYLNGQLVVDKVTMENYWERDKPIYPKGQLELQNHGNTLYFRNVYVRELAN